MRKYRFTWILLACLCVLGIIAYGESHTPQLATPSQAELPYDAAEAIARDALFGEEDIRGQLFEGVNGDAAQRAWLFKTTPENADTDRIQAVAIDAVDGSVIWQDDYMLDAYVEALEADWGPWVSWSLDQKAYCDYRNRKGINAIYALGLPTEEDITQAEAVALAKAALVEIGISAEALDDLLVGKEFAVPLAQAPDRYWVITFHEAAPDVSGDYPMLHRLLIPADGVAQPIIDETSYVPEAT